MEKIEDLFMKYLTVAEITKKKGFMWLIPEDATKPVDPRKKNKL